MESSIKKAWKAQHKKHLPIVIGAAAVLFFQTLIEQYTQGRALFEFSWGQTVFLIDVVLISLAAINGVFFINRWLAAYMNKGWKEILIKVLAVLISVFLMSTLLESIYYSLGYRDDDHIVYYDYKMPAAASNVVSYAFLALVIALPIFIRQRLKRLNMKIKENELVQEKLIQLKVKAELHALQSRINPHFLFNSFNSIASLISTDPDKAERMMVQLSELFRYSLNSQESNFVSIEEELKIVNTYLQIEKVRFGDKLSYDLDVPDELMSVEIPRFLLQPLVENAIKHATSKIREGELHLEIRKEAGRMDIKLFDNGPSFPTPIERGYGLQSTFDKLELLYPERHNIEFVNGEKKHIHIELRDSD